MIMGHPLGMGFMARLCLSFSYGFPNLLMWGDQLRCHLPNVKWLDFFQKILFHMQGYIPWVCGGGGVFILFLQHLFEWKLLCKCLLASHWLWLDHVPIPEPITMAVLWMASPELHVSPWTGEGRLRMAADAQGQITVLLPRRQENRCWLFNLIPTSSSKCVDIFSLYNIVQIA